MNTSDIILSTRTPCCQSSGSKNEAVGLLAQESLQVSMRTGKLAGGHALEELV